MSKSERTEGSTGGKTIESIRSDRGEHPGQAAPVAESGAPAALDRVLSE